MQKYACFVSTALIDLEVDLCDGCVGAAGWRGGDSDPFTESLDNTVHQLMEQQHIPTVEGSPQAVNVMLYAACVILAEFQKVSVTCLF